MWESLLQGAVSECWGDWQEPRERGERLRVNARTTRVLGTERVGWLSLVLDRLSDCSLLESSHLWQGVSTPHVEP